MSLPLRVGETSSLNSEPNYYCCFFDIPRSPHIITMAQENGYDFSEEEERDFQAELEEGFADIEQKCVSI